MITFLSEEHAYNLIIERAQAKKMPGMGGGLFDARGHIRKLTQALYSNRYLFAEMLSGPVVNEVLAQISKGEQAIVANKAYFLPNDGAIQAVTEIGIQSGIPGLKGGLIDTRSYVKFAVEELSSLDIYVVFLVNDAQTSAVWAKINNQSAAQIAEW